MKYDQRREEIIEICKTALTFTEVEARFGVTTPSTNLRRYIKQNKFPMPLYAGNRAGNRLSQGSRRKISDVDLVENSRIHTGNIKRYLVRTGKKQEKCEKCGWCEKRPSDGKIPVHLHHRNGDSSDNRIENIEILCPNCHSLTENYAGKNKLSKKRTQETLSRRLFYSAPKHICQSCGKLGYGEKYCSSECAHKAVRKVVWPTKEQLMAELESTSWSAIGRKYGVSDKAVRKWATHYSLI